MFIKLKLSHPSLKLILSLTREINQLRRGVLVILIQNLEYLKEFDIEYCKLVLILSLLSIFEILCKIYNKLFANISTNMLSDLLYQNMSN